MSRTCWRIVRMCNTTVGTPADTLRWPSRMAAALPSPFARTWIFCSEMLVLARFEYHLSWAPSLDGRAGLGVRPLSRKKSDWFERTAFQAARVRKVSRVGSHAETSGCTPTTGADPNLTMS